jgi:hypothetical protein
VASQQEGATASACQLENRPAALAPTDAQLAAANTTAEAGPNMSDANKRVQWHYHLKGAKMPASIRTIWERVSNLPGPGVHFKREWEHLALASLSKQRLPHSILWFTRTRL